METLIALIAVCVVLGGGVLLFILIVPFVGRFAFWWFDTVDEWLK